MQRRTTRVIEERPLSATEDMSQKRKSLDIEVENIHPLSTNIGPDDPKSTSKKSRIDQPAIKAKADQPVELLKSKIAVALKSSLPVSKSKSAVAKPVDGFEKRKNATEQSTAERLLPTSKIGTPGHSKVGNSSQISIGPATQCQQNLQALIDHGRLQNVFDTKITVREDDIKKILTAMLPAKGKKASTIFNNSNDKVKKLEIANTDLKDAATKLIREVCDVRQQCVSHESVLISTSGQLLFEYQQLYSENLKLASNESRLKKDLHRSTEELDSLHEKVLNLEESSARSNIELKELQMNYLVAQDSLKIVNELKSKADVVNAQLEKEILGLKIEASSQISNLKEIADQKLELSVNNYKDEIASLRAELNQRRIDVERSFGDKAEIDRKSSEMREETLRLQSELREAQNSNIRYEKEVNRLSSDLNNSREQIQLKENDLRSTLQSLSDSQKQATEDKCEMKIQINNLQSRIKSLEDERVVMVADLATKREECSSANREISQYRESITQLNQKLNQHESEYQTIKDSAVQLEIERELRSRCEVREEAERRERIAACAQLIAVQSECRNAIKDFQDRAAKEHAILMMEISQSAHQKDVAQEEAKQNAETILGLQSEIKQLNVSLSNASTNVVAVQELSKANGELEILRKRVRDTAIVKDSEIQAYSSKLLELEDQIKQGELQRRKLHNLVQELRGNVRVFARVRPFLPNDGLNMEMLPEPTIKVNAEGTHVKAFKRSGMDDKHEEVSFGFDRVFGPSCSQENIFNEVSEFVQSALDGYNVCLFSYGQTGSGKTHTMQGSGCGSMRGIIPRAMQQVGCYKSELETRGWKYEMEVSFVEIYNESIRDLLRANYSDDSKHDIKKDAAGNTYISDVTMIAVDPNNTDQIDGIVELAARHRSVAQTAMNERSSRSHSVFALHLRATNDAEGIVLKGTLNLVDLAGSERIDRSGVSGSRLQESVAINKSLSSLADVFVAIGNKQSHIPFRNSKLTYLLQPSLSGDGKTLMLVNLSPTEESYFESLCSLRFASQVNQCELGKPKRQLKDCASSSAAAITTSSTTAPTAAPPAAVANIAKTTSSLLGKTLLKSHSTTSSSTPSLKKSAVAQSRK